MCGLVGFIGESKNLEVSFFLTTRLLELSQSRGIDATGYWASETGQNGRVFYDKSPCQASSFIHDEKWKKLSSINFDLMICHVRGASKGVGEPKFNENNHPFVSSDKLLSLIHNGRIEYSEYDFLKPKYNLKSDCDSEIILKIIEDFDDLSKKSFNLDEEFYSSENLKRFIGINQVFNLFKNSHIAAAVAEKKQQEKSLWLFRNEHRPLWGINVIKDLGQMFFVSELEFWKEISAEVKKEFDVNLDYSYLKIHPGDIWHFFKSNNENNISFEKFETEEFSAGIQFYYEKAEEKIIKNICEIVSEITV